MIQVRHVTKSFGKIQAVKDVSFEIQKGEIVGFLGQNGAGKTTLMRLLTSYLSPTQGQVIIDGQDITKNSISIRQKIGYLPENPPLYFNMRVKDYLKFTTQLKDIPRKQQPGRVNHVLEECRLMDVKNRLIGQLSKGYKQRVGIAQAIINDPEILILDEPTNGLDPVQIRQVRSLIQDVEQKRTVLLSTHVLSEIEHVAERVLMIKEGGIIADDTLENLVQRPDGERASLEEIFLKLNGVDCV